MNFNSIEYLLFIPLTFLFLFIVKREYSWLVLLLGSFYFYLTLKHVSLLLILLLITAVTYLFGLAIGRLAHEGWKKTMFFSGIISNLIILICMKYLPFLINNLNVIFNTFSLDWQLPQITPFIAIGISYIIFQAISYLIDIYFEQIEPERHLGILALYLCFFPKLLQGPIERAADLMPQLRKPFSFDQENFRAGLLLFAWGLFKKAVVADRLALYVNTAYTDLPGHAGLPLLLATYFYAFQIYYDFSGYTDMAIGSARIFNIRLTHNFNTPYLATSIADFWRRWHISFSRWILDYIFKPLQIQWRDAKTNGTAAALIVTFLVSGVWHGASWGFVLWGGIHGVYLATSLYCKLYRKKLHERLGLEKSSWLNIWQVFVTFHLVCIAWIFFRAPTVSDAWYIITHLAGGTNNVRFFLFSQGGVELLILSFSLSVIWAIYWLLEKTNLKTRFYSAPTCLRYGTYMLFGTLLILFNTDSNVGFIYFKF